MTYSNSKFKVKVEVKVNHKNFVNCTENLIPLARPNLPFILYLMTYSRKVNVKVEVKVNYQNFINRILKF